MGITVEQVLTINGQKFVLNPETDSSDVECKFVCDSPRCAARNNGEPTFLSWTENSAREDIFSLSDKYTGLIRINPNPWDTNQTITVCCAACAKDYFTYAYQRPKSPRQLKQENDERLKVNPAAQEAIDEALAEGYKANAEFDRNNQMVLPFGEPTEFAAQTVEAVEDSTGYPN